MAERNRAAALSAVQRWAVGDDQQRMVAVASADNAPRLHREVWPAVNALIAAAADRGFSLRIASGFRSFERQLAIWNAKLSGARAVLDDDGQPVAIERLSAAQQVAAVLRFSALPGASRHHWGSDFDVYDAASLPAGYTLQLTAQEYQPGGVQAEFGRWLQQLLATDSDHPLAAIFYRPYSVDRGGVAIEPWHLSHRAVAAQVAPHCTVELLRRRLSHCQLAQREFVLAELPALWQRYIHPLNNETEQ